MIIRLFILLMIFYSNGFSANPEFKVALKPIAPFVIYENDKIDGFSVDLWREIAKDLNISSHHPHIQETTFLGLGSILFKNIPNNSTISKKSSIL